MNYSKDGLGLTRTSEGCKLVAYQDIVGVWTIGYGHTTGVTKGMTCTQAQAEEWLAQDLKVCADAVTQHVKVKLTQGEFDALVDFAFNLGISALEHSTLWSMLQVGNYSDAAKQFPRWCHADGKVVSGLLQRRLAEQKLFNMKG